MTKFLATISFIDGEIRNRGSWAIFAQESRSSFDNANRSRERNIAHPLMGIDHLGVGCATVQDIAVEIAHNTSNKWREILSGFWASNTNLVVV